MRKLLLLLFTLVSTGMFAQQKIVNPKCTRNAQGLITLEGCSTEHPQLSVKMNDECSHLTIYLNGQVMQELEQEDGFVSPNDDKSIHYLDANFDGHCDLFVGPGVSRTYSTLLLWNSKKGKFECADGTFQNFMIDPVNKLVYEGGSSSACESDGFMMKWNGNQLVKLQELKVIFDPAEYRANGVKYKYTITKTSPKKLIKATNFSKNIPQLWQKYVKTMEW